MKSQYAGGGQANMEKPANREVQLAEKERKLFKVIYNQ